MSFALPEFTTTLIEAAAFVLALGYVLLSIRQVIWGWPLMIVSSVLYGVLFTASRLYGQAALQGVFVAIGLWGWWQWRCGRKGDAPLQVTPLAARTRWLLVLGWAALSVASALALARLTDAAAPWLDALTTFGSLVGQVLTARKYVEAWPVWIVVNGVSVALFVQQQLWLTALLYGVFVVLSIIGWHQWRRAARVSSG
jgi:nicotinamide mononucleotide transporter